MGLTRVGTSGSLHDYIESDYLIAEKPRDSGYIQVYFRPDDNRTNRVPEMKLGTHHSIVVRHEPKHGEEAGRIRDVYERFIGPEEVSMRAMELAAEYNLPLWDTILVLRRDGDTRRMLMEKLDDTFYNDGEAVDWDAFEYDATSPTTLS